MRLSPACSARATAQRGQQRTAGLIPDWLSFSTSPTLHPAGGAGLPWLVSDVRRPIDVKTPIMLWTFSVNCVDSVTQWYSPEPVIPQRNSATQPRRSRHEMICHAKSTAAGSSGPRAGSGGPEEHGFVRINPEATPSTFPFPWFTTQPGQPRPPAKERINIASLQTGEHPPEVSTPQCITEGL